MSANNTPETQLRSKLDKIFADTGFTNSEDNDYENDNHSNHLNGHGHLNGSPEKTPSPQKDFIAKNRRASYAGPASTKMVDEELDDALVYKSVTSKLFNPTSSTMQGQWKGAKTDDAIHALKTPTDLPAFKYTTSKTLDDAGLNNLPERRDSRYATVESRLHNTTTSMEHAKWRSPASEVSSQSSLDPDVKKKIKAQRRFSTSIIPTVKEDEVIIRMDDLMPREDLYGHVKSRLLNPTKAVENAKWQGDHSSVNEVSLASTIKPKFTVDPKTDILDLPLVPIEQIQAANPYKQVRPRYQEMTACYENSKWKQSPDRPPSPEAPPFVFKGDSVLESQQLESPSSWSNPYTHVRSRLNDLTKAYTASATKKYDDRKKEELEVRKLSISPKGGISPDSRLLSPTVCSKFAQWNAELPPPPPEFGKPQLVTSKSWASKVESKLHDETNCTRSRFLAQLINPEDEVPTMAFGHPIEDAYRSLLRSPSPKKSNSSSGTIEKKILSVSGSFESNNTQSANVPSNDNITVNEQT